MSIKKISKNQRYEIFKFTIDQMASAVWQLKNSRELIKGKIDFDYSDPITPHLTVFDENGPILYVFYDYVDKLFYGTYQRGPLEGQEEFESGIKPFIDYILENLEDFEA